VQASSAVTSYAMKYRGGSPFFFWRTLEVRFKVRPRGIVQKAVGIGRKTKGRDEAQQKALRSPESRTQDRHARKLGPQAVIVRRPLFRRPARARCTAPHAGFFVKMPQVDFDGAGTDPSYGRSPGREALLDQRDTLLSPGVRSEWDWRTMRGGARKITSSIKWSPGWRSRTQAKNGSPAARLFSSTPRARLG